MNPYKRPEKETDPDKLPGQIVNRPTHMEVPLVKEIEEYHSSCCHRTMVLGYRCEGCPYAQSTDILVPRKPSPT